jgi:hypothetical protein
VTRVAASQAVSWTISKQVTIRLTARPSAPKLRDRVKKYLEAQWIISPCLAASGAYRTAVPARAACVEGGFREFRIYFRRRLLRLRINLGHPEHDLISPRPLAPDCTVLGAWLPFPSPCLGSFLDAPLSRITIADPRRLPCPPALGQKSRPVRRPEITR